MINKGSGLLKYSQLISIIIFAMTIVGCSNQYWTRSDSIYLSHGDAVRSNVAVQVPDPWPKKSENTNIPMDPVKSQHAIECYRLGQKPSDPLGPIASSFRSNSGGTSAAGSSQQGCQQTGPNSTGYQSQEAQ